MPAAADPHAVTDISPELAVLVRTVSDKAGIAGVDWHVTREFEEADVREAFIAGEITVPDPELAREVAGLVGRRLADAGVAEWDGRAAIWSGGLQIEMNALHHPPLPVVLRISTNPAAS